MKEMTKTHATYLGGSVKKTLLVVVLATMLLFAVAGSAFAINHSGQQRLGARAIAPANVAGVPVAGAGTDTYMDWNTALGDNATNGNSPHGNYTTTTVKCVVCHAVHYAAPGTAPVGSGQTADTLLRMKASDACIFCHATTGEAVNGTPVYDGLGGAITPVGATGGNTLTGHIIGNDCSECHTNVHGANADHSVASLDGFLLKLMPTSNVQNTGADSANMLDAITAIDHNAVNQGFNPGDALAGTIGDYASTNSATLREQAVGVFCAQCHNGAYATGTAGASTNVLGSGTVAYSGHRIAAAATSNWNADGSKSSGLFSGTVAYAAANDCKSCHDANDTFGNKAFPHSWGQDSTATKTKMWLLSAADAGDTKVALPAGGGANAYNANRPQLSDGVCLKCHVAAGGTEGVGITF
jgi:hypothetical protein